MPPQSESAPLNDAQKIQLIKMIADVRNHGFGRIEIRVEKGQIRWFRPGLATYEPRTVNHWLTNESTLEGLLGAWMESFASNLAEIAGHGFGSLFIGVEHGRIRFLEAVPDIRARTGKTGPLRPAA